VAIMPCFAAARKIMKAIRLWPLTRTFRIASIYLLLIAISSPAFAAPAGDVVKGGNDSINKIPRPDHVVIVVEENKSYTQIIGNAAAPYINALANNGALFTQSFGVTHPSQPNYLALFSGTTHGIIDDRCPLSLSGDNLATELIQKGLSFAIYSESMPSAGYAGCAFAHYFRKHNPLANWSWKNTAPPMNLPFDIFPSDYSRLPTVSIVVPNQLNDMHDGAPPPSIIRGDRWLKEKLDSYVKWAATHNSLLILTWDEDDNSSDNHIPTIFVGPMVKRGIYKTRVLHYHVLRTIIDMYELRPLGETIKVNSIKDIWTQ
jgi:phospholipase C